MCLGALGALLAGCTTASSVDPSPNDSTSEGDSAARKTLVIFHNATGPMCLEALIWLDTAQTTHPGLVVEEHLTTEAAGLSLFSEMRSQYAQSQGVSTSFGYLPVIFFDGQAFSGFNGEIKDTLTALIDS